MHYYSFNDYLRERFGEKVRRIGLNAGFTCPHKGAKTGSGGCVFCNELAFSEFAQSSISLREQMDFSIKNFNKKGIKKFVAYFQNATNTNAKPEELKEAYDVIREYPEIVGLGISTRPDCIDDEKLDLISEYTDDYDVWIEYGVQTVHEKTLNVINRGHTFLQSTEAIEKTAQRGIKVGVHIILGLPGESKKDMVDTARKISELSVSGVKLHVLSVFKETGLEKLYDQGKVSLLGSGEYVKIACDFLENLRIDCVVLRLVSDARDECNTPQFLDQWLRWKMVYNEQNYRRFKDGKNEKEIQ